MGEILLVLHTVFTILVHFVYKGQIDPAGRCLTSRVNLSFIRRPLAFLRPCILEWDRPREKSVSKPI
jgi:hypothetical protein